MGPLKLLRSVEEFLISSKQSVVFDSLFETPGHKVGVHLTAKVGQQREDKGNVETVETSRTHSRGHGAIVCLRSRDTVSRRIGSVFRSGSPFDSSIVTFPDDLALLTIQLEHHETGSDSNDDEDQRPYVKDQSSKHVTVVAECDDGKDTDGHGSHTDTSVDLGFWVVEEEEHSIFEEQDRTSQVV